MADDRKITIEIEAKDYASSVFRSVTSGISAFGISANNGIYRANNALRMYNSTMMGFNYTVQRALYTAGRAIYNFTADAIKQFAELERQHAKTMGAMSSNYNLTTPSGLQQFSTNSQALMNQSIYMGYNGANNTGSLHSPQEISAAQTALVKAGISEKDILNTNALSDVIKFAGGNDLSLDTAVEFAVQLGSQFNYDPSQWGEMLDQVTYAANASIIDVEDIIASMQYAGNMSAGYDQPLHEILAALALMGQSGLKGSTAGTGIQAIFSRGMSTTGVTTAGKPPTENVESIYNDFVGKVVDSDGNFMGLGNFSEVLAQETAGLSDQEVSWFYKKLFGMFQQKAGLALTSAGEGEMSYQDYVDAILENAQGTNDKIYEVALETTYGNLESVENAWLAFKTQFGQDLSPITISVARQLREAMVNKDFDFDTDVFRDQIQEAGKLLVEDFGEDVADAFTSVATFLVDSFDIGLSQTPLITGSMDALIKILNGDFEGGWQAFKDGIEGVNENIDDLPPELQDTANAIKNLILIFEGLFALNIVTRVGEAVTSFVRLFTGNKILSAKTTVTSGTASVNSGSVTNLNAGQIANATVASMMANTTTMTVYANVVNVIGGGGLGGNGTGGSNLPTVLGGGSSGMPILIGGIPPIAGGSIPLLTGGGAPLLAGGASSFAGNTSSSFANSTSKWIPGATSRVLNADGSVAATYFGSVSGAQIANVASKALKVLGTAGLVVGMLDAFTIDAGINNSPESMTAAYNQAYGEGYRGDDIRNRMIEINGAFIEGGEAPDGSWFGLDEFIDFVQKSSAFTVSGEGMQMLYDAMVDQINSGSKIDEDFLNNFFDTNGIDRGYGQGILEQMLNSMFDSTYTTPKHYFGEYADSSVNTFVKDNIDNTKDWSQFGTIAQVLSAINGKLDGLTYVEDSNNVYQDSSGQYFQFLEDGTLQNISSQIQNASSTMDGASTKMEGVSSSLSTIADKINPSEILNMGQGPLSPKGLYDYLNSKSGDNSTSNTLLQQISNNTAGAAANQALLQQISGDVAAIDPSVTVDITNPAPTVNVKVNVDVDKSGNVSQDIIKDYIGVDNWIYQYNKRNGG